MPTPLSAQRAGTLWTRNPTAGRRGLWTRAGLLAVLAAILTTMLSAGMSTPVRASGGPVTGVDGTPMRLEFLVEGNRCDIRVKLGRIQSGDPDPKVHIRYPDDQTRNYTSSDFTSLTLLNCAGLQGPQVVEIWPLYADVSGGSNTGPWLPIYGADLAGGDGSVSIPGMFGETAAGDDGDIARMTRVLQWGELGTTSLRNAFNRHHALISVPNTLPPGVTDTGFMFTFATAFNDAGIANWSMTSVTSVRSMFDNATAFNQPIGDWDVSSVTDMESMFEAAAAFNQPIGNWNVSSVKDMESMFERATAFNQPIGNWNVSSVKDMESMFERATAFNQPIGNWNVSSVKDMESMFRDAVAFNQPIGDWAVSSVTNMEDMFRDATSFDRELAEWNVSKVKDMDDMFRNATSFDRSLGNWTLNADVDLRRMFNGSGLSSSCYDATLIGWAALDPAVSGRGLGASGREYSPDGAAARTVLVDGQGWEITGDTAVDVATGRCADSVSESSVSPTLGMTLGCTPPDPTVGVTVTCTVTAGDADIDILWRAAYNPVFAEAGLTLDANGTGTFSFVVPAAALGQELTVELVEWTQPIVLGVVGGPVPASVPAGEGPVPAWSVGLLALLGAAGAVLAGRRLVTAG